MFCPHCGKEIPDNSDICSFCGCSTGFKEKQEAAIKEKQARKNAIIALCFCWFPIAGIAFSVSCLANKFAGKHKTKAIIALVLSIVFAVAISVVNGLI